MGSFFTFDYSSYGKSGRTGWAASESHAWEKLKARNRQNGRHVGNDTTELQNGKLSHVACDMDQWLALLITVTKPVFTKYTEFLG